MVICYMVTCEPDLSYFDKADVSHGTAFVAPLDLLLSIVRICMRNLLKNPPLLLALPGVVFTLKVITPVGMG